MNIKKVLGYVYIILYTLNESFLVRSVTFQIGILHARLVYGSQSNSVVDYVVVMVFNMQIKYPFLILN